MLYLLENNEGKCYICLMITRVKDVSERKGVSYGEIAQKMGVSSQSITNWTTGQRQMKLDDLAKIAEVLQTDIAELLPAGISTEHLYNEKGEWLGIRKK